MHQSGGGEILEQVTVEVAAPADHEGIDQRGAPAEEATGALRGCRCAAGRTLRRDRPSPAPRRPRGCRQGRPRRPWRGRHRPAASISVPAGARSVRGHRTATEPPQLAAGSVASVLDPPESIGSSARSVSTSCPAGRVAAQLAASLARARPPAASPRRTAPAHSIRARPRSPDQDGEHEHRQDDRGRKTREAGRETGPVGECNAGGERGPHGPSVLTWAGGLPGRSAATASPSGSPPSHGSRS